VEVARHHLSTCAPGEWLADPIINMYMALLQVGPASPFDMRCVLPTQFLVQWFASTEEKVRMQWLPSRLVIVQRNMEQATKAALLLRL
jgi:hypothetical protein